VLNGGSQILLILAAIMTALSGGACQVHLDTGAVRMGPIVRASAPGENVAQVWAYADPQDGRHLIACGMISFRRENVTYGYVFTSPDAGATWQRTLLDDATRWVSEESCTYGQDGRAYFVDGQSDTSTGFGRHAWGHLQIFTSNDHGMTWKPAGRREWVDWTMLAALPADQQNAESLAIFGNAAADQLGHFSEKQPVALEATDGARRLSVPVTPSITSVRNFGSGSVALPGRTALFAVVVTDREYANDPGRHRRLNLFAYKPSERSVDVRATLRNEPGRAVALTASIVRDPSRRFHGRLYAAWSEYARPGSDTQLWLATSDDNGYHWSSRPILSIADYRTPKGCPTDIFSRPPDVRIGVNRAGVLGVLWQLAAQSLLFAVSVDGGRTFQDGELVVHQPPTDLSVDSAVPFNEWSLGQNLAVWQGKSPEVVRTFADPSRLGLSVRLTRHTPIGDFALTADAKNVFHAFWTGVGPDGNYALMTRNIEAPLRASAVHSELTSAAAAPACGEDTASLKAEGPTALPSLEIPGQADISGSVNLRVDHVEYAAESHIVTAAVSVMNKTANPLQGPPSLFAVGLHSDFGVAKALNADGVQQGQPFWNLSAVVPSDGLPPNTSSKPVQLQFKIDQFYSVPTGDAVAMQIRVFAEAR
jgi:hypothetical protein